MDPTIAWIDQKFGARPIVAEANKRALKAGYAFGETTEIVPHPLPGQAGQARRPGSTGTSPATRRRRSASSPRPSWPTATLFYGSYPITPASDILHQLSGYKTFGVKTFQAEDEIAAIGAAIGASLRRRPGPDRVVRAGHRAQDRGDGAGRHGRAAARRHRCPARRPSTGMPTKNEQADLLQVMFGRNSDSPLPIVAPGHAGRVLRPRDRGLPARPQVHDPGRLPVRCVPRHRLRAVDGPVARRTWPSIAVENATDAATFRPYQRDPDTLARPWAVPGTAGLEHRIGGLEKADITGNVSYDPDNHHRMQTLRAAKVAGHRRRHRRRSTSSARTAATC